MTLTTKAEPRFDRDLKYGQEGEQRIEDLLGWVVNGDLRLEVKRKRVLDCKFYVETHCDKGRRGYFRPSGINATESKVWCFVIADTGIHVAVPTELLRASLDDASSEDKEETDGTCPTRGKLIDLAVLLNRLRKRLGVVAAPRVDRPDPNWQPPSVDDVRW